MSQMTATVRPVRREPRPALGDAPRPGRRQARLRVVDAAPTTRAHTGFVLLCLALVLAVLLAALLLNTRRAESSYVLGGMRQEVTALHDERVTLEAELAALRSPESLARQANRLGMVPSPSTAVLRLSDGTMLGVAAGVDPANSFTVVTHASSYQGVLMAQRAQTVLSRATTAAQGG